MCFSLVDVDDVTLVRSDDSLLHSDSSLTFKYFILIDESVESLRL